MEENKYRTAGWLAIVQAVMFPLMFIAGILEAGIGKATFGIDRPFLGPTDLVGVLFTGIVIYVLLMFRKLLNERYENHDLDFLILITIWWSIVFQVLQIGIVLITMIIWPIDEVILLLTYGIFFTAAMVSIGIVDIMIAVRLLRVKEIFSDFIRAFAYVTMVAGVCEITVFLAPIALLLVPVTAVILALIFFNDKPRVEFV